MDRGKALPEKKVLIAAGIVLAVLMVVGSIGDFSISKALYNQKNPFGLFFAGFGEYPAALGFAAAGTMLLAARNQKKRVTGILQLAGGAWFILSGAAMAAVLPKVYLDIPIWMSAGVGVICTALTVYVFLRLCRKSDRDTIIQVAAVFILVIFVSILLVNVIKIPWGRARMRLVAVDSRAYFMPWWQPGSGLKDALTAAGVAAEEFKSFPSGHTANASVLMLLCLVPVLSPQMNNRKTLLFGIGFAWAFLVAVSRIIMGAHYLTDTVVGWSVGLLSLIVISSILLRRKDKIYVTVQPTG